MKKKEIISDVTRIIFFAGIITTIGYGVSLLKYIPKLHSLTDEEKKIVGNRIYIIVAAAGITTASAIVGSKAYAKT